ncbi:MAG: class I SAM-dependent methyltransferase [Rickettsiales bacterium]|nr:class I SAM-dependent methyltransferase [Rickettsiales bacterium]
MDQEEYQLEYDYRNDLIVNFTNGKNKIKFNLSQYYLDLKTRIQTNLKKEPLFKLIKANQTIIDATSGLLQDSLILAAFNKKIICFESEKQIFKLQEIIKNDILAMDPFFKNIVKNIRIELGKSINYNKILKQNISCIYVDLMFDDTKNSAPKKSKQLLRKYADKNNNYAEFIDYAKANKLNLIIKSNSLNLAKNYPELSYQKFGNLYFYQLTSF